MHSESFTTVLTALASAKAEFGPIVKKQDGQVGNQKIKYADLDTVLDVVEPVLANHGLVLVQPPEYLIESAVQTVASYLFHVESGEWIKGTWKLTGKEDPQGMGSALTYGRRYCTLAILGLAPEDDDGTAARRTADRPATPPRDFATEATAAPDLDKLAVVQKAAAAAGEWVQGSAVEKAVLARKTQLEQDKAAEAPQASSPSGS